MRSLTSQRASRVMLVILLAGVVIGSGRAHAADAGDLINGKFDAKSKAQRVEIAQDVLSSVEKLAQFLPSLKPSEQTWARDEFVAIDKLGDLKAKNSRAIALYESPEFQHEKLFAALEEITNALRCAMDKSTPIRREMVCWAVASINLTDANRLDDSIGILLRSGRLPKDIVKQADLYEGPNYSKFFGWHGRGMLEYLIIPYLRRDIAQ